MKHYDVVIVGAGAAGLMCALTAGKTGKSVLVLEKNAKPGAKILISGGGRCNFTNQDAGPENYLSSNPHFGKSALARYTPWDFMSLLVSHEATWHEKKLGQLFCDQGAKRILKVLLDECASANVDLECSANISNLSKVADGRFEIVSNNTHITATNLILACGAPSIPKMGATGFAYDVARQFGIDVIKPEPALVPFIFDEKDLEFMKPLAGVAVDSIVSNKRKAFRENILFTHRGLSGPAILQISSYWYDDEAISINLMPAIDNLQHWLIAKKSSQPKVKLKTLLADQLPARLSAALILSEDRPLGEIPNSYLTDLAHKLGSWKLYPKGTEGFPKAEVTRGGINTDELSSKTMEAKKIPNLYFIGECVDVTGWLGGYNFQWAWASGWAAAKAISS